MPRSTCGIADKDLKQKRLELMDAMRGPSAKKCRSVGDVETLETKAPCARDIGGTDIVLHEEGTLLDSQASGTTATVPPRRIRGKKRNCSTLEQEVPSTAMRDRLLSEFRARRSALNKLDTG